MKWGRVAGALCVLLGAGCSGKVIPTGGLMIVMSQDGSLSGSLAPDELKVHITSVDKSHTYFDGDYSIPRQTTLPASVAIATNGDANASVLVDVTLLQSSQPIDERLEHVIHIPTDQVTELDVIFSSKCRLRIASPCSMSQTCDPATGNCVDDTVNASQLPPYQGDAGSLTTGDAGSDAADSSVTATDAPAGTDGNADASMGDGDAGLPPSDGPTVTDATVDSPADAAIDSPAIVDAPPDVAPTPDGGDPEIDYGIAPTTFTMSAFQVQPGQEVVQCETFVDPWQMQVDVKEYSAGLSQGGLRLFAFYVPNATASAGSCPGGALQWGPFTFAAQTNGETLHYPLTVGATIPAGTGFQLAAHYINSGTSVLSPTVSVTMYLAKASVVTQHAGVLFLNQQGIMVPSTCTSSTAPCTSQANYVLTQDVYVVSSVGMMSRNATSFIATSSTGATLFQTNSAAGITPKVETPALHIGSGATITWSCADVNNTAATLYFGGLWSSNVMCVSSSAIYPITDPTMPVIGGML
jgi:hypothetical protein